MKGYIKCDCGEESCLPTHPDTIFNVTVPTESAMSISYRCPTCNRWITAQIYYEIVDSCVEDA